MNFRRNDFRHCCGSWLWTTSHSLAAGWWTLADRIISGRVQSSQDEVVGGGQENGRIGSRTRGFFFSFWWCRNAVDSKCHMRFYRGGEDEVTIVWETAINRVVQEPARGGGRHCKKPRKIVTVGCVRCAGAGRAFGDGIYTRRSEGMLRFG